MNGAAKPAVDPEIACMMKIIEVLAPLTQRARARVIQCVADRLDEEHPDRRTDNVGGRK